MIVGLPTTEVAAQPTITRAFVWIWVVFGGLTEDVLRAQPSCQPEGHARVVVPRSGAVRSDRPARHWGEPGGAGCGFSSVHLDLGGRLPTKGEKNFK